MLTPPGNLSKLPSPASCALPDSGPHLVDVPAVGAVALQAGGAGATAVAGVLVHLHAVHTAEAGVGAAVGTLLVEAWGEGAAGATKRSPLRSPEVEARATGRKHGDAPWSPAHSPTHRTPDTP